MCEYNSHVCVCVCVCASVFVGAAQIAARKIAKWFHRQRIKKFLKMLGIIAKARLSRQRREREWKERLEGMRLAGERVRAVACFHV